MRFHEFINLKLLPLSEVRMNPASLRQAANKIDAKVGIEFELIVPNIKGGSDNLEPSYHNDEAARSIEDIIYFFGTGNSPMRSSHLRQLERDLERSYSSWVQDRQQNDWERDADDYTNDYINHHYSQEEIDNDEVDMSSAREEAKHRYFKGWEQPSEEEWLNDIGIERMSDVVRKFGAEWSHNSELDDISEENINIKKLIKDFQEVIGQKVIFSKIYHEGDRTKNAYIIEPDASIVPNDKSNEIGLEFISPPLTLSKMITDFRKVVDWAKSYDCYTNDSTGLHINVSVPEYRLGNVDFIKLVLLLGDEYVLKLFGREANNYCKSALKDIKNRVNRSPQEVKLLLDYMKGYLASASSNILHNGLGEKNMSVHMRKTYVEFRSPGGDWLNFDIDLIEDTIFRFVVALDAALDPEKYRKEYLKKLYKLLSVKSETDPIAYFSRYMTGDITKDDLKKMIISLQQEKLKTSENQ